MSAKQAQIIPIFNERNVKVLTNATSPALADDAVLEVPLPRGKYIQKVQLRLKLNVTTPAGGATYTEDSLHSYIKKVEIVANHDDILRKVTGTLLFFNEKTEKGEQPENTSPPTAASTTGNGFLTLNVDFMRNRKDDNDITALLPARRKNDLFVRITLGKNTDITASAITINYASSTLSIDVTEVSGVGVFNLDFLDIRETYKETTNDAAHASFDTDDIQENITPVPSVIFDHAIIAIDNALRDDDIITDLMLKRSSPFEDRIITRKYNNLQQEMRMQYAIATMVTGYLLINYRRKLGQELDRTSKIQGLEQKEGDLKLHFLTGAPTGTSKFFLFTRYLA